MYVCMYVSMCVRKCCMRVRLLIFVNGKFLLARPAYVAHTPSGHVCLHRSNREENECWTEREDYDKAGPKCQNQVSDYSEVRV